MTVFIIFVLLYILLSGIDIVGKKMESFVHKFFCCYNINERCTLVAYKIRRTCKLVAQTVSSDAFNMLL